MNKTQKCGIYRVIMFIIPVLLVVYYLRNIGRLNMIFVLPDEYGYWMTAAAFAGYDWSGLSSLSLYYSYGYSIILTPLFWIFKEPVLMYKAALCLNALLYIGAYFISCACGFRLADAMGVNIGRRAPANGSGADGNNSTVIKRRRLMVVIVCGVIALYCNNAVQVNIAWSEALLYFMFWLSFYTLLRYCESRNMLVLAAFGVEVVYMYIIHQRMLGVLIAAGMTLVGILVRQLTRNKKEHRQQDSKTAGTGRNKSSKKIWSIVIVISAIVAFILIFFVVKKYLAGLLWSSQPEDRVAVNNFSGQIKKMMAIFSADGIVNFCFHVCGKFFYLFLASGSLVFWAIAGVIDKIISGVGRTAKTKHKTESDSVYMPVYIYMLLAMLGLLGITSIFMNGVGGRMDAVVYGRYVEPVIGVVMLVGVLCIMEKKPKIYTFILYLLLFTAMALAADYLMSQGAYFVRLMSVGSSIFYKGGDIDKFYILPAIAVGLVLGIVVYIAARFRIIVVWAVFAASIITFWHMNVDTTLDKGIIETHKYMNQVLYLDNFMDNLEDINDIDNVPIYFINNTDTKNFDYNYRIFHLQFLRKNDTIKIIDQAELEELEKGDGNYFLIQYHVSGIDIEKYRIVTQNYGLSLMVPRESELAGICNEYTSENYYEFIGEMSGSETATKPGSGVFDSDYKRGFVIFVQDLCLTPGRYQVDMELQVTIDEDEDVLLYEGMNEDETFPRTIGYANVSYGYGAGMFNEVPVIISSPEELKENDGIIHVTYEFDCDEYKNGVEMRFYSEGCSKVIVNELKYRTVK